MIIFVSASSRAKECAVAIEEKAHQETQVANSLAKAIELLQAHEYDVIVVDESFQQVEASTESLVAHHAGAAMPVYVNLSLHGTDRVAIQVNLAIQRLVAEKLALREGQLPTNAAAKVKEVHDLAERIRVRLDGQTTAPARIAGRGSAKSAATAR